MTEIRSQSQSQIEDIHESIITAKISLANFASH